VAALVGLAASVGGKNISACEFFLDGNFAVSFLFLDVLAWRA
jgi:hypothetical protein